MSNRCFNIKNDKICFVRSTRTYVHLVWLAHLFGWKPKGTRLDPQYGCYSEEEIRNWKGGYFLSKGQIVDDDDAHAMGDALYIAAQFYRYNVWEVEELNEEKKRAIWNIIYDEEQENNKKRNRISKIIEKYLLKKNTNMQIVQQKAFSPVVKNVDQFLEIVAKDKELYDNLVADVAKVFDLFYSNVDEYDKAEVFYFFVDSAFEVTV